MTTTNRGVPETTSDGRDCVAAIDALAHLSIQRSTTDQVAFEIVLSLISLWLAKGAVSKTLLTVASLRRLAVSTLTRFRKQLYQTFNFVVVVPPRNRIAWIHAQFNTWRMS